MMQLRVFAFLGAMLLALLIFALGIAVGAIYSGDDFNTVLMPFLSMTGTWASGIGTLAAVVVALHIATQQARDARLQGSLRCAHYAMVLVDDLISRVKYQKVMLEEGGRPLASMHINAESMASRYEGLFQHDLYVFLPGPVLDALKKLAVGFFNQSVMSEVLQSELRSAMHVSLPANMASVKPLCDELDRLATDLELLKDKLYEFRSTFPANWHI